MLLIAVSIFTYYTIWALLLVRYIHMIHSNMADHHSATISQPLLDDDNPLQEYFPSREWVVRLPAFTFVVGLAAVGSFVGVTIVKEKRKKAQKIKARSA